MSNCVNYRNISLSLVLAAVLCSGCGDLSGQFGFKTFLDQAYKKVRGVPEFRDSEKIRWVFVFDEVGEKHPVGIIIQKKEIVWVDISKETRWITPERKILYGTIENYTAGYYKLLILDKNKKIGVQKFTIYTTSDDEQ